MRQRTFHRDDIALVVAGTLAGAAGAAAVAATAATAAAAAIVTLGVHRFGKQYNGNRYSSTSRRTRRCPYRLHINTHHIGEVSTKLVSK